MAMTTSTYILELKLQIEEYQRHCLQKRFEIARVLYNRTLSFALKQHQLMSERKVYRHAVKKYAALKKQFTANISATEKAHIAKELKATSSELTSIRKSFHLSDYQLHSYIKKHQHNYKKHIDSHTAQKIASTVWIAMQKVLFEGKRAHFKKYGNFSSVEGKTNAAGIRYKQNAVHWNGLTLPCMVRDNDLFAQEVLSTCRIKFVRLVRKIIRGINVFYAQLVLEGTPPVKRINLTGAFRQPSTPHERVGIDLGTSTIAIASPTAVSLQPLFSAPSIDKKLATLQRKLDRSRRATNSDHFHSNGTIKRGIKLRWVRSNTYMKTLHQVKEVQRLRQVKRKSSHSKLANYILTLGDTIYVEQMNFIALSKRAKETKVNAKGKNTSKKRFGKSIGNAAPALLINILTQKLSYLGKKIHKVNTSTFRASQYNHLTDSYEKKTLSERWNILSGHPVQRDLYSAFLLMNSDSSLQTADRHLCLSTYDDFKALHDSEMKRLKNSKEKYHQSFGL